MNYKESDENIYIEKSSSRKNLKIKGYASVFNNSDTYNDVIIKGAFEDSLKKPKFKTIKLLWQHDETKPIGIINDIYEDHYGLYLEAEINSNTQSGKEAIELVIQGAVGGLSIGFNVIDSHKDENGARVITAIDLWEVSIVTFPANDKSLISSHFKIGDSSSNYLNAHILKNLDNALLNLKQLNIHN